MGKRYSARVAWQVARKDEPAADETPLRIAAE